MNDNMEERWRADWGKCYYYIDYYFKRVERGWDNRAPWDNLDYFKGNYYRTEEEAEAMASKLRAVLKGAEVIEMPSEEEIKRHFHRVLIEDYLSCDRRKATFSEGCIKCYEWLKSKIVK